MVLCVVKWPIVHNAGGRGVGGEAKGNAVEGHASCRWLPNLRLGHHCGGDDLITRAGQSLQARIKRRR